VYSVPPDSVWVRYGKTRRIGQELSSGLAGDREMEEDKALAGAGGDGDPGVVGGVELQAEGGGGQ